MMTQTTLDDRILPLITAPEVFAKKLVGYRYFVELVSKQFQVQDDRPVPVRTQTIDVVVQAPTIDAISQLLATCEWLKDYSIVSYSKPLEGVAPF